MPSLIVLVGFMGAGKTSVGRLLARRLRWRFVDLDDLIVAREGRSVPQIFADAGEPAFRRAETRALTELLATSATHGRVAALGGGAFAQVRNRVLLRRSAVPVVWLDAPVDELEARCRRQDVDRPLARDPYQFRQLYKARQKGYREANVRVNTSRKSVAQVAAEVHARLRDSKLQM